MRKLSSIMALFFVLSLVFSSLVSAVSLENNLFIENVEVNDQDADVYTQQQVDRAASIDDLNGVAVDEGETLEVQVVVGAQTSAKDVQIEAEIRGYEYSDSEDLSDRTQTFDMDVSGTGTTTKRKTLTVKLPQKLDKDRYFLRLTVDDKDSAAIVRYVVLQIEPSRHGVDIHDVTFSPSTSIKAGRSLLTTVLLRNFGDKDQKDVKVTVEIPALGVQATEFVDRVNTDNHNVDYEDVAEMFLPIPATAEAKEYTVIVTARYDDLRKVTTKTYQLNVLPNEAFGPADSSERLVLAVGPESQTVAAGKTATYGIALSNDGRTSKVYTVEVTTGDWATAKVSESLVVLEAGKSKVVYVDVTAAKDATAGEHIAAVQIKEGSNSVKQLTLKATVVPAADNLSLRNGLEIALIVLVVLLVIIGLIVGFSKLRKDDDEEKNYY